MAGRAKRGAYKLGQSEYQKQYFKKHPARRVYMNSKRGKVRTDKKFTHKAAISDFMTQEEFEGWYKAQLQECRVCGFKEELVVDHCHNTGRPRGILCQACNKAEGFIKTLANAEALVRYMRES